jgi:hypothetical protein
VLDLGEEGRLVEGKGGDTFIVGGSFINLITLPNVSLTTLLEESLLKFLLLLFCLLFHFIIFIIWIICNEMSTLTTIIAISFAPWLVVLSVVLLVPQDLLEALDEERYFLFIKFDTCLLLAWGLLLLTCCLQGNCLWLNGGVAMVHVIDVLGVLHHHLMT